MLSVCCRYGLSQATINKLFHPNLRNFTAINPRTCKPSLVRSSILDSNAIPKRNNVSAVKGERYRKADKVPEGYTLIYRERYVSMIVVLQLTGYIMIPTTFYHLLCFHFEKNLMKELGLDRLELSFKSIASWIEFIINYLRNFDSIFDFFSSSKEDSDDPELEYKKVFPPPNSKAFEGDEYLMYLMVFVINIYMIRTAHRMPLRIYKRGTDRLAVFFGWLGPLTKTYVHFKPSECRPIEQIRGLVWRKWQVKIKDKYHLVMPTNFKTIADLNSTCIPSAVPTFLNKVLNKLGW